MPRVSKHSYTLKVHYPGGVLDLKRSAPVETENAPEFLANVGRRCMQLQRALKDGEQEKLPGLYDAALDLYEAVERIILSFDTGDLAHTTLNGRSYLAVADARAALARARGEEVQP